MILSKNTAIDINERCGAAARYAASALERDLKAALTDDITGDMIVVSYNPVIPNEGYEISADGKRLTVAASDDLGAAYGLYRVSEEFLGFAPFWYWNEQVIARRPIVEVNPCVITAPEYRVKYRGWFINDEVLIDGWRGDADEHWRMIFEALLRCGGNMCIPGTDKNSALRRDMAWDMGLAVTHHHAEPLGAEMFSRVYPNETPSYTQNPELFRKLWREAAKRQAGRKVLYSVGFRGQGDRPFWADDAALATPKERGALINHIIREQMAIVREYSPNAVFCVNMYGEFMPLHQGGHLNIPQDVIKVWGDNGYGKMVSRRQGNNDPRIPAAFDKDGAGGVYYHCSFHDLQASNHLTMSPNPTEFLADELEAAYESGAENFAIVNCGSLKPHVYTLDLVRQTWLNKTDAQNHRDAYAKTYFPKTANIFVELSSEWGRLTAQYGKHADNKAGEQFWHHPARELICAYMRGERGTVESLRWLHNETLAEQAEAYSKIAEEAAERWPRYNNRARALITAQDEPEARRLYTAIGVQIALYAESAAGAYSLCESLKRLQNGDYLSAFIYAGESLERYRRAAAALESSETERFKGFYDNDCLTDVRLTAQCVETLRDYIRAIGDGPSFCSWQKAKLFDKGDAAVELLSCVSRPLDSEELYRRLECQQA